MVDKLRVFFFDVLDTRERVLLVYGLIALGMLLINVGQSGNRKLRKQAERNELADAIARRLR